MRASHSNDFSRCEASALGTVSSVLVVYGLNSPVACGIFSGKGSNPFPLHWQVDSTTGQRGSPAQSISAFFCVLRDEKALHPSFPQISHHLLTHEADLAEIPSRSW